MKKSRYTEEQIIAILKDIRDLRISVTLKWRSVTQDVHFLHSFSFFSADSFSPISAPDLAQIPVSDPGEPLTGTHAVLILGSFSAGCD